MLDEYKIEQLDKEVAKQYYEIHKIALPHPTDSCKSDKTNSSVWIKIVVQIYKQRSKQQRTGTKR